ncbi:MAG: hypothetical protein ACW98D_00480 [Promethearchaeota archaeon]|jgi:hypothetical protein
MKKTSNKSTYFKIERRMKHRLWESGFVLVLIAGFSVVLLIFSATPLIIILILISGIVISDFHIAYSRLKLFRNSPYLQKKVLVMD